MPLARAASTMVWPALASQGFPSIVNINLLMRGLLHHRGAMCGESGVERRGAEVEVGDEGGILPEDFHVLFPKTLERCQDGIGGGLTEAAAAEGFDEPAPLFHLPQVVFRPSAG